MNLSLSPRINRLDQNIFINGGMELAQRGTSFVIPTNVTQYTLDRIHSFNDSTTISITASQDTSVPSGTQLTNSFKFEKSAAGSVSTGTNVNNSYKIEGYDILPLMDQEFSVIFWVKSSIATSRSLTLLNAGTTHYLMKQYNIDAANTWELKVIKFPKLSDCPGTLNRTNGIGLELNWAIFAGSSYQGTVSNTWQAGAAWCPAGQDSTWITGTNHDFYLTGIMIMPGDWTSLTPASYKFVRAGKNIEEELAKAQRYYEKSYPSAVYAGGSNTGRVLVSTNSGGLLYSYINFKQTKRSTPTVHAYAPAIDKVNIAGSDQTATYDFGENGGSIQASGAGNSGSGYHWTADAEL